MPPPEAPLSRTGGDLHELARENGYLRQRNAQLQADMVALQAEAERLRQIVERMHGRSPRPAPNPLSGGQ